MICADIQRLIAYAIRSGLITRDDELVARNLLMDALGVADWSDAPLPDADVPIDDILAPLVGYACQTGVIEDTSANRDLFDTKLMGILTPMPREIIREFRTRYAVSPVAALAIPALTTPARTVSPARRSCLSQMTGAALTTLRVKVPARWQGASLKIRAMSLRP